jgi:hypothetical protein
MNKKTLNLLTVVTGMLVFSFPCLVIGSNDIIARTLGFIWGVLGWLCFMIVFWLTEDAK